MIGGINNAASQIANIYNQGNSDLANTLVKIASGKKFQTAGEDLISFSRANNLSNQISGYGEVEQKLTSAKTATTAAVDVGSKVYENLSKLKETAEKYAATTDPTEKAEYEAEFNSLRDTITTALDNANVDGKNIADGTYTNKVNMDPEGTGQLTVTLDTGADSTVIAAFDIAATSAAAIDTEIKNSLTYLSDAKSYNNILENQISLNETIVNSKEAVMSLITDIDEAAEMSKMLDQNVRQEAAMSMLSQANMSRQVVMKLYGNLFQE